MILIVTAVEAEIPWLKSRPEIDVLLTGVGPVDASALVAGRLARGDVDMVVNAGVGGAFPGVSNVGEALVVYEEFMEIGLETGEQLALPGGLRIIDRVHASPRLIDPLLAMGYRGARGITVSRVTATDHTAARLAALGAEVESMEGFAVLRAAAIAHVPAVELRGISNMVGDRAAAGWNLDSGSRALARITTDLMRTILR